MTLASCILFFSMLNQVPVALTHRVIAVESSGNPFTKGKLDDYGLMQIRARYVAETPLQLMNSCTNVMRGTALLAEAQRKCSHKIDNTWINCYNLGIRGGSRLKHPKKFSYYRKIAGV